MYYELSAPSFSRLLSQVMEDRFARVFLRLICFSTASILNKIGGRTGQLILSNDQLLQLKACDPSFLTHLDELGMTEICIERLETITIEATLPKEGSLKLPYYPIAEDALFTTPVWRSDLESGYYGPSMCFGDLIKAWREEGLALSQLTGLVSIIDLDTGMGQMYESHIIGGIGLKGSNYKDSIGTPKSSVELIKADDWFSLAQFGAISNKESLFSDAARLEDALLSNNFNGYREEEYAWLFLADVRVKGGSIIRREFSPTYYQESPAPPFTLIKECEEHLEALPDNTRLTIVGKIHPLAEAGFGARLDTLIHVHAISSELFQMIDVVDEEKDELFSNSSLFSLLNSKVLQSSIENKLHCGHLKVETGECSFKSVEKIRFIQKLSHVIEVSKTGALAYDVRHKNAILASDGAKKNPMKGISMWSKSWRTSTETESSPAISAFKM